MAEVANKWFIKEEELETQQRKGNGPDFLYLKKGDSVRATFLDEDLNDIPILKVFTVYGYKDPEHKYPSHVLAPASSEEESPLAEYWESLEDGSKEKSSLEPKAYYCTTMGIQRKNPETGDYYPCDRVVRKLTAGQMKWLRKQEVAVAALDEGPMAEFDSMTGLSYILSRSTDQLAPKAGELGNFVGQADLTELLDNPKAFTTDELLEKFEQSVEDQQAYVDRMNAGNDTRPVINR